MKHSLADALRTAAHLAPAINGVRGVAVTLDPEQPFPVHVVIDNDVVTRDTVLDIEAALFELLDEDRTSNQGGLMTGSVDRVPVLVTPTRWVLMAVGA